LQNLFTNLKTAPTRSVKPTQDLAELTLFSAATEANFRRASISSPAAPSLNLASYLDPPVYGPELPPPPPLRPLPIPLVKEDDIEMVDRPSHDPANQDDDSSDATLVELEPPTPNGVAIDSNSKMAESPIDLTEEPIADVNKDGLEYLLVSKDIDKPTAVSTMDGAAQSKNVDAQEDQVMTNGPTSESVLENAAASPEKPPPVPPRNKPAPIQTAAESEESLRAQKLYFGAQQDVTEVIGNVMFRLQCAIKPTSIDPKFGEQIDKIRETFYGANAVYLKKANTYDVKIEDWANIIVFPSADGPRSIYEALDVVFDEQIVEINNTFTTQYASISKLPPIFQTQIQRTAFDPKTQQASKNQNPIVFEETIYLDRYMDTEKVMQRRKDAWKWKNRIRKLEARQKVLENTPVEITVPDAIDATKNFIRMLEEEEIDGIIVNPTLSEALDERRAEIIRELDTIAEEVTNLKKRLQDQFTDMREHRYRLQAVFIHRGTSTYGHYWIYIYDFERDIWREYNDERVSVVNDRKQIFEQTGANGPTPYYLVYVKDQLKDDLVDAVCREIVEEEPEMPILINEDNVEMDNGTQHIEDVSLIRHQLDGSADTQSRDLAQMGSWDQKGPHANDAPW
jgi:ubiquitin carboxyl-terminal hydrolase 25